MAYLLARPYWGQGLTTEAARASLRFGFEAVGLETIIALVHPENARSIRAGRLPAFYAQYDRDWRTFNAALLAQHRRPTLAETAATAQDSHCGLLAAVGAVPAEDVRRDFGVRSPGKRRVTIAMLLEVEARDECAHAGQIREFAARLTGPAPAPAI